MHRELSLTSVGSTLIPGVLVVCALLLSVSASAQDETAPEPVVETAPDSETVVTTTEEVNLPDEMPEEEQQGPVSRNVNFDGGIGFHKIASANIGSRLKFRTAFLGQYFNADDVVRDGDQQIAVNGHLILQSTINKYFAANFALSTRSSVNNFGQPETMLTLGDANLGLTGVYPATEYLNIGFDLGFFVPTDFGTAGPSFSAMSVRPRLLGTLDVAPLTEGDVPLQVHLNLGYMIDNSSNAIPDNVGSVTRVERFAYQLSQYDLFEVGVGFEYSLPYVRPFVGYWMGLPINGKDPNSGDLCAPDSLGNQLDCYTDQGFGAAPKILSLGAKADPIENLGVHLGVDIGLATKQANGLPVTPPYNLAFGLSWTIDSKPKVEYVEVEKIIEKEKVVNQAPALARINGSVVNSEDESSVKGAVIEYLGQDVSAQATSQTNGNFTSYGFAKDTELKLRVTHPDYEPAEVTAKIGEKDIPLSISLKPIPKIAQVRGRVVDTKGKPIRTAQVSINGPGGPFIVPVDAGGNFTKEIKPGSYTVAVRDEAYLTRGRDITLKADDKMNLEFELSPKPKKSAAKLRADKIEISEKVYFDSGKATIKARSFNLLNQIASILLENPKVNVRIEGHTDDKGNDDNNMTLSRERANSVRDYLIKQGVSGSRLQAVGYGETRPILPNVSNRNRTINRRVEFNVVTQPAEKKVK